MSTDLNTNSGQGAVPNIGQWRPSLMSCVLGCIIGALISTGVVHSIDPVFSYADLPELGLSPSPELQAQHNAAQVAYYSQNYGLNLAIIGACVGIGFGVSAAIRQRMVSGLLGGIGGAIAGGAAAYLIGMFVAQSLNTSEDQSLIKSALFHGILWGSIGFAVVGPVTSVQSRRLPLVSTIMVGLISGVVVAIAYNVLFSLLFSDANLLKLIPATLTERVAWSTGCGALLGISAHYGLQQS